MELYALSPDYKKDAVIDEFESVIWTERFSTNGDVELKVEPTKENIGKLAEGTFLALAGSKEVMYVDTSIIENNVLKVTGNTLDEIFKHRFVWLDDMFLDLFGSGRLDYPENAMCQLVEIFADPDMYDIPPDVYAVYGDYTGVGVEGVTEYHKQTITHMDVEYSTIPEEASTIPVVYERATLFDLVNKIGQQNDIGYSLFLNSIDSDTTQLNIRFKAYRGRDLTRDQLVNDPVVFSSAMDNLVGISRLRSLSNYKTVVYSWSGDGSAPNQITYLPGTEDLKDFERRDHFMVVSDATVENLGSTDNVVEYLQKEAKDFLANNNYIKMLDGEIVPQSQFKFGVDYGLGDIVELDDESEITTKARVTEYIRSQDQEGEKAYPTVSVID